MKQFLIFIITLGLSFSKILAQSPCPEVGISTDPNNPINPQKPHLENTFDWTAEDYQIYNDEITNNPPNLVKSPFFQGSNGNIASFVIDKDRLHRDGWELVQYDFGTPSIDVQYVHLVLYNKYTGILRVFLAGDDPNAFNGTKIYISFRDDFTDYYSSVLSSIYDTEPMDKFDSRSGQSVGTYLNGFDKWFYADFNMGYDPCTCLYESTIFINVDLINTAFIDLTGSLEGNITTIDDNNDEADPSWSFSDALNAGKKANKTYSSIEKWVKDQERALEIEGKTEAQLIAEGLLDKLTKKKSLNDLQEAIKGSSFLKAGLKAAPYIGAAFELVSFFIGGGKKPDGPQEVKIMPMSIQADIALNGTITGNYDYKNIIFYTPGSKNAEIKDEIYYPLYNEVLGVMNIMKTPKAYSEALIDWICVWGCFGLPVGSQLKLTEGIEYVLNPAAGFKPNPEIEMAWRIVYPDGTSVQSPLIPGSCFSEYTFSSSALLYPDVNVYVKVFANLEREDADGNTQNVLWVSEYPVELQSGTPPAGFFYSGAGVISPNTTSVEFTQTNPTVIGILSGNNTYAWKDMTISVEMIAQSFPPMSFPFVLGAGSEINLEPGAIINTGLELRVFSPTACQSNLAPLDSASIATFCTSNLYKAPRLASRPSNQEQQASIGQEIEKDAEIKLYPNPAQDLLTLEVFGAEDEILAIDITDIYGTLLASWQLKEASPQQTLSVSHLLPGVYICHIQTKQGYHTKRFVKE